MDWMEFMAFLDFFLFSNINILKNIQLKHVILAVQVTPFESPVGKSYSILSVT